MPSSCFFPNHRPPITLLSPDLALCDYFTWWDMMTDGSGARDYTRYYRGTRPKHDYYHSGPKKVFAAENAECVGWVVRYLFFLLMFTMVVQYYVVLVMQWPESRQEWTRKMWQ